MICKRGISSLTICTANMSSFNDLTSQGIDIASTHSNFIAMVEPFLKTEETTQKDQHKSVDPYLADCIAEFEEELKEVFYNNDILRSTQRKSPDHEDTEVFQLLGQDIAQKEYASHQGHSMQCNDEMSNQRLQSSMEEFLFFDNFVRRGRVEYTPLIENALMIQNCHRNQFQTASTPNQNIYMNCNHGFNNLDKQTNHSQYLNHVPAIPRTVTTPSQEIDSTTSEEDLSPQTSQNATRKGKRQRTQFTGMMILALEREFQVNPFISKFRRAQLSLELGVPDKNIKVWFQNRRMKAKRVKPQKRTPTVNIAPESLVDVTVQGCEGFQVISEIIGHEPCQHWSLPGSQYF